MERNNQNPIKLDLFFYKSLPSVNNGKRTILEYFGTPGAGKTYLASKHRQDCFAAGEKISHPFYRMNMMPRYSRLLKKLYHIILTVLNKPQLVVICYNIVFQFKIKNMLNKLRVLFNWMYICSIISYNLKKSNTVVLDQGVSQALWSSYYYGNIDVQIELINEVYNKLMTILFVKQIVLVYVMAPTNILKMRINNRSNSTSPLESGSDIEINYGEKLTLNIVSKLHDVCLGYGDLTIYNYNNA